MSKVKVLTILAMLFLTSTASQAEDISSLELISNEIISIAKIYYPDTVMEVKGKESSIKANVMTFKIHPIMRDGKILEETREEEGPKHDGFSILISGSGRDHYEGPLEIPQILNGTYWKTYVNEISIGESNYWVVFNFGARVNKDFKSKILENLK